MNDQPDTIAAPILKVASVWSLIGLSSVQDAATWAALISACLAALYTTVLLCEWSWKRIYKPLFLEMGWIKPRLNLMTESEYAALKADKS